MNFRLKIFLFLFLIVSTTMLLSYLYGIRVVEGDRRNFINEYLEHRSAGIKQKVSGLIQSLDFLSDSLCIMTESRSAGLKDVEDFIKKYLRTNSEVKGVYFTKSNITVKFGNDDWSKGKDTDEQSVIQDGYVLFNNKGRDCIFSARFYLPEIIGERDLLPGTVLLFLKDSVYMSGNTAGMDIDEVRKKTNEIVSKSPSGVFVYKEYVLGYSVDPKNTLSVIIAVKRELFESAIVSLRYSILLAGLFSLAFFLIIGFLVAGRITRPMTMLKEKAQLIKKGMFEKIDFPVPSDEIGEAVTAFNKMVDDLREKEANLRESQMRLVQAEKMSAFGQLSAGIAHEVKNPLTSVFGYIQLARRIEKDEKVNEYLRIAENETLRCKQILEDLLKFARMDRHQKAPLNLQEVVGNTIRLVNHQMMMKKIKLVYEKREEKIVVNGNANQLQQVFLNIFLNAMQSVERKGRGDGCVTVDVGTEGEFAFVSVRDNGEGIPSENIQKIFEPFFTTKADSGGTGLGLSISFGIIREHNGDIKVNSVVGEGTEFKIYLPVHVALC